MYNLKIKFQIIITNQIYSSHFTTAHTHAHSVSSVQLFAHGKGKLILICLNCEKIKVCQHLMIIAASGDPPTCVQP